jgi:acetyltransferase-like isoleucine patch superfamily enzyme
VIAYAPGERLAEDWWDAPLPAGVELGERTWFYSSFAFLHCHSQRPVPLRCGEACSINVAAQFALGPHGEVEIGHHTTINGTLIAVNGRVEIGDHNLIGYDTVIADDEFWRPLEAGEEPPLGPTTVIGDNTWINPRARLIGGITVGDHAVIGTKAVVREDVPAGAIVAGDPARVVGWVR